MSPLVSLLERLGVDPAIAGDLIEEYASGRSRTWLLWQSFAAAAQATAGGIGQHKVLVIRAIFVGVVALNLVSRVLIPLRGAIEIPLERRGFAGAGLWFVFYPHVFVPTFVMVRATAVGWITGRLHRPYSVPLVTGLAMASAVTTFPEIYRLSPDSLTNTRFILYLCLQVGYGALMVVGLLVGAAMSATPSQDSSRS